MYGNAPEIQLFLTVNFKLKGLGLVVNVGGLYKNIFLSLQMVRHISYLPMISAFQVQYCYSSELLGPAGTQSC